MATSSTRGAAAVSPARVTPMGPVRCQPGGSGRSTSWERVMDVCQGGMHEEVGVTLLMEETVDEGWLYSAHCWQHAMAQLYNR
jgi:hypothetical protein